MLNSTHIFYMYICYKLYSTCNTSNKLLTMKHIEHASIQCEGNDEGLLVIS